MNRKEEIKEELWCESLKNGYTMRYGALGGSMSPFIKGGSILTVKPRERISIGDVILYKSKKGLTAHRVIGKRNFNGKSFFVTKGDNLRYRDDAVSYSEILGKVVRVESEKKKIELDSLTRRVLNYAIAIASPLFLPMALSILRKIKAMAFKKVV